MIRSGEKSSAKRKTTRPRISAARLGSRAMPRSISPKMLGATPSSTIRPRRTVWTLPFALTAPIVGSRRMRPVTPRLRLILEVFAGLALIAGALLFFGATRTDAWWAWTIAPPLTAATLGAFYWAAFVLILTAARSRTWAAGAPCRLSGRCDCRCCCSSSP